MRLKKNNYLDIHRAIIDKNYAKVKDLLKNKVSPNKQTGNKNTPLHIAVMRKEVLIIKLLQEYHANPNLKNSHGSTPLHIAANKRKGSKIIRLLLNMGVNINKTDRYGNTPLHIAMRSDSKINTIKMLLKAGANPNALNNDFETPFSIAKKEKNTACITLLSTYGAKIKNNKLKLLKLAFTTMPALRKVLLISFSMVIIATAVIISILTSGKTFMGIFFAILASLGMAVLCLGDQYHKMQEVEKKIVNKNIHKKND